jgi:hypothetical protein
MSIPPEATLKSLPRQVVGQPVFSVQFFKLDGNNLQLRNVLVAHSDETVNVYFLVKNRIYANNLSLQRNRYTLGGKSVLEHVHHDFRAFQDVPAHRVQEVLQELITPFLERATYLWSEEATESVDYCEIHFNANYRYQKALRGLIDAGVGAWHYLTPDRLQEVNMLPLSSEVREAKRKAAKQPVVSVKPRLSKEDWLKANYPELKELPKWRFPGLAG